MSFREQAEAWLATDPDPITRAELQDLLGTGDEDALAARFASPLSFGTAGLRGPIGAGPGAMNQVVVGQAAAGFAAWLSNNGHGGGTVIIGYDARHRSEDFARNSAEIFAGAGFQVLLTDQPTPTPVVAFGIQHFGCVAGVVVTASHNPPQDNGYKVYLGEGSQIVPPEDAEILAAIREVTPAKLQEAARGEDITIVGDQLRKAYLDRAVTLVPAEAPREVTWVHTAMHGVGSHIIRELAPAAGFPAAHEVAEQAEPDPDFPTVSFPNPEEPGAIDLALAKAEEVGADVVIANDPDADRCAVAAVVDGKWRMLTGDELGVILGADAIERGAAAGDDSVLANSIVSSTWLSKLASDAGRRHQTTLTGFKWIGRVPELGYGYEEAIGYCCDPAAVPDKDGLTAALAVLRITAALKAEGRTLADRLDELTARDGLHATSQLSVRVDDLQIIADAMTRLRSEPPATLLGRDVAFRDLLDHQPPTNGVELTGEGVRVVVRPSGTEPKLKCYCEVVLSPAESADASAARQHAAELLEQIKQELRLCLGLT